MIERLNKLILVARQNRLDAEHQYETKKTTRPLYFSLLTLASEQTKAGNSTPDNLSQTDIQSTHPKVFRTTQRILQHVPDSVTGIQTAIGSIRRENILEGTDTSDELIWSLQEVEQYAKNLAISAGIEWKDVFPQED